MRVAGILAAALALRLLTLVAVEYSFGGDAIGYRAIAESLLDHQLYSLDGSTPTALRAPGFPFFAAAVWSVSARTLLPVQLAHIALQLVSLVVLALAVRRRFAVTLEWPLALLLLNPLDVFFPGAFLSETVTSAGLAFGAAALLERRFVLAGVALGLASLGRDVFLLLPLALVAATFVRPTALLPRRGALVVAAVAFITVAPWTLRNALSLKTFIPISKGLAGYNLWAGTWERDTTWLAGGEQHIPDYAYVSEEEKAEVLARRASPRPDDDQWFMQRALDHWKREPLTMITTAVARLPRLWGGTRTEVFTLNDALLPRSSPQWYAFKVTLAALNGCLAIAGFVAGIIAWKRRHDAAVLFWFVLYTTAVYFPFNSAQTRFSQPVVPMLAMLALLTRQIRNKT
jgi:hypothetical protein